MEEIIKNITSVSWWFSVVVVGLLISVLGGYMKSATDRTVAYVINRLNIRKRKGQESEAKIIEKLNSDSDLREFIFQGEMRAYFASFAYFSSGMAAFAMFVLMQYSPELASVHHLASYSGFFGAAMFYLAGTKFLSGAYLGRGLIIAAKAKFDFE